MQRRKRFDKTFYLIIINEKHDAPAKRYPVANRINKNKKKKSYYNNNNNNARGVQRCAARATLELMNAKRIFNIVNAFIIIAPEPWSEL